MSRLYSYLFGSRHHQEMETKLHLLERRLEEAEMMGRYRDAKLIALLDRFECLEAEFRRQKTTLLQQTTALEEQLVHARQTRSNSTVQPLQPITDASESKPAIASADIFLVDAETAQPLAALKFADCIAPARQEHNAEISAMLLEENFFRSKLKGALESSGRSAPSNVHLYRCDTMSRIKDSNDLGRSAKDMYQSNGKGQMAYCICGDSVRQDPSTALRAILGTLKMPDSEKTG